MKVKQVLTHRLVLPIAALLVLILVNTISRPVVPVDHGP